MSSLDALRHSVLNGLFTAFNRHDSDGVMACMTDDIVFDAAAGPNVYGRRFAGASEVRAAFEGVWNGMADASWQCTSHCVFGDRAISEWIFRGTGKDGRRIEAEGCDLFRFRDEKICSKSAFRKDRPLQPAADVEAVRP